MITARSVWTLVAAAWFGLLGGAATLVLDRIVPSVLPLAPFAVAAAVLVGGPAWWVAVERGHRTWLRAAVAGGATGLFAHPVLWSLVLLSLRAPLGTPGGVVRAIALSGVYGVVGLLLVGWVTVPLSVGGGLGLLAIRRRL